MGNYDVLHYNEFYNDNNKQTIVMPQITNSPKAINKKVVINMPTPEEIFRKEVIESALLKHNELRTLHGAPELKINDALVKNAQEYSESLAAIDALVQSDRMWENRAIGESLATCEGYVLTGDHVSKLFYDEIKYFDFNKIEFNNNTKQFTQLIWADTKEVGFGRAMSKSGKYYFVANYYPPGNIENEDMFKKNIFPKMKSPNK